MGLLSGDRPSTQRYDEENDSAVLVPALTMAADPQIQPTSTDQAQSFTSAMRLFGGFVWGTLTTLGIAVILILIPQVPRSWLWGILPLWLGLVGLGIVLQWSVARGNCPRCGQAVVVPSVGKRCPHCRTYLKAVDRKVVKMA